MVVGKEKENNGEEGVERKVGEGKEVEEEHGVERISRKERDRLN